MVAMVAVPPPLPPLPDARGIRLAGRSLWFAFIFMLATIAIGLTWDGAWHARHRFETFWSPPHLFIYTTTMITVLLVARLTLLPELRRWFGPTIRLRLLSFAIPGALFVTAGGLATLAFAGLVLDNAWHTRFGLDETPWSAPHSMLGWAWFVTALGFIACRLALRPYRPLRGWTALLLGWLVLGFSATPFLGPFQANATPDALVAKAQRLATFPALLNSAGIAHVQRIEAAANLTRTNPAFLLFAALWAGVALGIVRRLDRRAWVFLLIVGLWSLVQLTSAHGEAVRLDRFVPLSHYAANWLPPPIFPAALTFVLLTNVRVAERWAWLVAGGVFGLLITLTWGTHTPMWLLVPLAIPILSGGAWLGTRIVHILEAPTSPAVVRLVPLLGMTAPVLVGGIDLYLRHTIA